MQLKQITSLLILLTQILLIHTKHTCTHEDLDFNLVNDQINNERKSTEHDHNRVLPSVYPQQPQPMRVTIDYSLFSTMTAVITEDQKAYLVKIMENSKAYFQKLLKVIPMQGRNIFRYDTCYEIKVPEKFKRDGENNSDINIFVLYDNNPNSNVLANAIHCQMDEKLKRVNYGRVRVNMGRVGTDASNGGFEADLNTVIHEMLHIFGFSPGLYSNFINPKTGDYYGDQGLKEIFKTVQIRGKKTYLLMSKNILETARKYYGCPSLEGMQLENDGSGGSMGAHWEKTIIINEIMTAESSGSECQLSVFTVALLKDTGFYAEVNENMVDDIQWGKNRGCDFAINACSGDTQYPEFALNDAYGQCSPKNDGYGSVYGGVFMDNCQLVHNSVFCNEVSNASSRDTDRYYEQYGSASKCLESTANDGTNEYMERNSRCHNVKCSPDFQTVTITISQLNKNIVCSKSDEGRDVPVQFGIPKFGSISCPDNYFQFCSYTSECPNYCSQKGVCIAGQCLCNEGWTGIDCTLPSSQCRAFTDNGVCVNQCPRGKYANPDKVCRENCPRGYFTDRQYCTECHLSCSQCNGIEANNCLSCQFLTFLQDGKCVSQCSPNSVAVFGLCINSVTGCDKDCERCDAQNKSNCTQCRAQTYLNLLNRKCVQYNQCPPTTYADNTINQCVYCSIAGCKQCETQTTCAVCDQSIQFYKKGNLCSQCPPTCETCQPDLKTCLSCKIGFYLKDSICQSNCGDDLFKNPATRKCEGCLLQGCLKCYSSTQCEKCDESRFYFRDRFTQQCIFNDCQAPCVQCKSNNKSACTKCDGNLVLINDRCESSCPRDGYWPNYNEGRCEKCYEGCFTCVSKDRCYACDERNSYFQDEQGRCVQNKCQKPCKTCLDNDKSACLSCERGMLYKNVCYQDSCPKGTYIAEWICKECQVGCSSCNVKYCYECNESAGYFMDRNDQCYLKQCNSPCQSCNQNNKSACLSCEYGYLLSGQQCVRNCPSGTNPNYNQQVCESAYPTQPTRPAQPAQPQPNKPTQPTQPNKPQPNQPSQPSQPNRPQPNLPSEPRPSNDQCKPPCKECVRGSSSQCVSCQPDLFLYQQECNPYCPYGTYYDMSQYKCFPCDVFLPGCTECSSAQNCRECDTRNGFQLSSKQQNGAVCIRKRMLLENKEGSNGIGSSFAARLSFCVALVMSMLI